VSLYATNFSCQRLRPCRSLGVEQAMLDLGVIFFYPPLPGVRLRPKEKEFG
jgi:hypothetical protein